MIHLDRSHHHDLDQTQKQNLILSRDHDAPHFDWDDLSHTPDPQSFFPLSPHNILLPTDSATSPAHPTHDLRDDKSSSLSPAPDSGSPPPPQQNTAPHPPALEPDLAVEGTLTPLTELSPAPDLDDAPEDTKDAPDDHKDSSHPIPSSASQDDHRRVQPTVRINGTSSPPTSSASSPSRHFSITDTFSARLNGAHAGSSHSRASSGEFLVPPLPSGLSAPTPNDSKVVRILEINAELFKCVHSLCFFSPIHHSSESARSFSSVGSHSQTPCFNSLSSFSIMPISSLHPLRYAGRLQVNLTWLAAAADQRHNVCVFSSISLVAS